MIELLAPAGDLEKLKIAYLYGADACFIGGTEYSLRARASNFSLAQIKQGARFAHKLGKKLYVTTNIIPHNENLDDVISYLKELEQVKVDGIIVASPFIARMAKKHTNLEIHVSTQQSITNHYHIKFFEQLGAKRVVLGRELSLGEIKKIKNKTTLDIEVFIHGGMCASYSGRCSLSNTFTLRDANRGGCAHSCRWEYDLYDKAEKLNTPIPFQMGSKDLQAIRQIKDLIEIGVDSLKIEGRMKSVHYIATVVNVYRMLIDEYQEKGQIKDYEFYEKEIAKAENRLTASGFLEEDLAKNQQIYSSHSLKPSQIFVGLVLGKENSYIKVEQRNFFKVGDKLEVFGPGKKPEQFILKQIFSEKFESLVAARHPQEIVYLKIPFAVEKYDMIRLSNE